MPTLKAWWEPNLSTTMAALDHGLIPRFNHLDQRKLDYVGGWHYQTNIASFMFPHHAHLLKGFSSQFKEQVRFLQPGFFHMVSICKVLARKENYVTVDLNRPRHLRSSHTAHPFPVLR
jgi:hypothetical protein